MSIDSSDFRVTEGAAVHLKNAGRWQTGVHDHKAISRDAERARQSTERTAGSCCTLGRYGTADLSTMDAAVKRWR